jgi:hypothetical protein
MMEPNFETDFQIRPFEYEGPGSFEIGKLEGANLDVLQREVTWKLEERRKQMEGYLDSHGISIDGKAIHERVEKIMGLDEDALDTLEKEVNAKLKQKKRELERLVKSQ